MTPPTVICDDGYPRYQRRNDGRSINVCGANLDNRWIVPYNPALSLRYGSHINLEACISVKSVKYIFKYVYKGHDCIMLELVKTNTYGYSEISIFLDARYINAPETMWRLSEYHMHEMSHSVFRLQVHQPDQQQMYFQCGLEEQALERASTNDTQLTAWFMLNHCSEESRKYLYTEIPLYYTFNKKKKMWQPRKRGGKNIIVRMYSVSPSDYERYCLRLLLLHVTGAKGFGDLRTYDDTVFDMFREACLARGMLADDSEWDRALSEAVALQMPQQCRQLFVTILTHCQPSNPRSLWDKYEQNLAEDFAHNVPVEQAVQCAVAEIDNRLCDFRLSCRDIGLPIPDYTIDPEPSNIQDDANMARRNMAMLNEMESEVVGHILNKVDNTSDCNEPQIFYLDDPDGTGKTMVYKQWYIIH